jgi:hypothetical protein
VVILFTNAGPPVAHCNWFSSQDRLKAIAVEGLSTSETAEPGAAAEEIADLVLYYGDGENFATSEVVQTAQFKYKTAPGAVTASYLRKTVEKFAGSIIGYEKDFSAADVDKKLTFPGGAPLLGLPKSWRQCRRAAAKDKIRVSNDSSPRFGNGRRGLSAWWGKLDLRI